MIISYKVRLLLAITTLFLISVNMLNSQGISKVIFDSKGTDFWLAFPPNYHRDYNSSNEILKLGDSLYIYVVSEKPTKGKIEFKDIYGNYYTQDFIISNPKNIYTFKTTHMNFEVCGYNLSGKIVNQFDPHNQCEVVGVNAFHVTTDDEVTIYAHSQAVRSSDSFLVLPTDVLGKEYLITSYPSDGYISSNRLDGASTPSQFLIIASQDSTNIYIKSPVKTFKNRDKPINIILNKGQVFLVQAYMDPNDWNLLRPDLTGTEVLSDRPIAVISGHQRAKIPSNVSQLQTRDCLIEQMLPIKTWGKNAFIIPYILPLGASNYGSDLYRVMFCEDNTELYLNGNFEGRYNKGDFFQNNFNSAISVEASNPILVTQYKKSSKGTNSTAEPDSDPFMMLVPPKEQFMSEYYVINTQAYEHDSFNDLPTGKIIKVYSLHYIALAVHQDDIDSTQIDNKIISQNDFKKIPTSEYYYANIPVSEGPHHVISTGRFGIYVYGYGYVNSYGYIGGLSMLEFDLKKPKLQTEDSCYKIKGMAFDSSNTDTKIRTLTNDNLKNINVNVEVEKFSVLKDSAYFKAQLINKYDDGSFVISAIDSVGLDSTRVFDIPGFTVALDSIGQKDSAIYLNGEFRTSKQFCQYFNLQNYGKFDHNITKIYFKNNSIISKNLSAPFLIKSKENILLEVCFSYETDTLITDTLYIEDDCGGRKILIANIKFTADKEAPLVKLINDSCNRIFNVKITENRSSDWGLREVELNPVQNCKVTTISQDELSATFIIEVIDFNKDAIFYIYAEDSLGYKVMRYDTIQGFTLGIPQLERSNNIIDYGIEKISYVKCDSIVLQNSGLKAFSIDNLYLKHNIAFSIPKSVFPLVINPTDSHEVFVCFQPTNIYETFRDTIVISFNCFDKFIALEGIGDSSIHYGEADCGVIIKTVAFEIDPKYLLDGNLPNPVTNLTSFNFQIPEDNFVTLEIFDLMGNRKKVMINSWLNKGYYSMEFDLSDLSQGIYLYIIKTPSKVMRGQLIKL